MAKLQIEKGVIKIAKNGKLIFGNFELPENITSDDLPIVKNEGISYYAINVEMHQD